MPKKTRKTSKFEHFILVFGARKLARRLGIDETAVSHWMNGRSMPDPKNALKVQRIAKSAGVELSLEEIYRPSREVRTETSSLKPQPARV